MLLLPFCMPNEKVKIADAQRLVQQKATTAVNYPRDFCLISFEMFINTAF